MGVLIANTPLTIEGETAEIAELIDLLTAGRVELELGPEVAAAARAPGHATGARPRCTTCGRNHQPGKCKGTATNGRKAVAS